jgi:hypothetical protein
LAAQNETDDADDKRERNGMRQSYALSVSVVISSAIVTPASTLPLIGGTSAPPAGISR